MIQKLNKLLSGNQQARYVLSGGLAFVLEYGVFIILFELTDTLLISNSLSFLVGLSASFILHKLWSFAGNHTKKTHHQFTLYVILAGINLIITNIVIKFLVSGLDIPAYVAKILVMALIVVWNFVLLNRIIFKAEP